MQDILRERKQKSEKNGDDRIAEALTALYKKETNKTESGGMQKDAVLYRKLARPRSPEYLNLIKKQIQLTERLNQLYRLQQGNDGVKEENVAGITDSESRRQNPGNGTEATVQLTETEQEQEKEQAVKDKIAEEIARLQEEIALIQAEAEAELPIGCERLGFIYGSDKENRLLNMGVISCGGKEYSSQEEMLQNMRCVSEKEKQQWIKADSIFVRVWWQCLIVEVFPTLICVVYEDGSVSCYRDE